MATYRLRNGRCRAEIFKSGIRRSKTFATKEEATAWATSFELSIESQTPHTSLHRLRTGNYRASIFINGKESSRCFADRSIALEWLASQSEKAQRRTVFDDEAEPMDGERVASDLTVQQIISCSKPYAPVSGVYFLILEDRVVYVGESSNVYMRIAEHRRRSEKGFTHFHFVECGLDKRKSLESEYIKKLRPRYNKKHLNA